MCDFCRKQRRLGVVKGSAWTDLSPAAATVVSNHYQPLERGRELKAAAKSIVGLLHTHTYVRDIHGRSPIFQGEWAQPSSWIGPSVDGTVKRMELWRPTRGLRNPTNICFMNSTLQCLATTPKLMEWLQLKTVRPQRRRFQRAVSGAAYRACCWRF